MSYNRKNSVKFASAVLTGALVLTGAVPAAAQTPDSNLETEAATAEVKEKIVFLSTADAKESHYREQAVHSMEEALAQFEDAKKEDPAKAEPIQKEKKILILCTGTEVSDEEKKELEEKEISLMTEADYEAALKAKEEAAKKEAEKEIVVEVPVIAGPVAEEPVIESPAVEEPAEDSAPSFIWKAPEIHNDTPSKEEGAQTAEQNKDDSSTGILLPGFSLPSGVTKEEPAAETEKEKESADKTESETSADAEVKDDAESEKEAKDGVETETEVEDDADAEKEAEAEETEEVVFNLFAFFDEELVVDSVEEENVAPVMLAAESADTTEKNPLVEKEENSATVEETPSVMLLPGIDLVGNGTSGVGGGSKPSSQTGSTPSGNTSTGNTSTGNTASNSTVGNGSGSSSGTKTPAPAPAAPQRGIVQTGDASNRPFWGLTAGISGAMAAYFAAQWRRFRREEE